MNLPSLLASAPPRTLPARRPFRRLVVSGLLAMAAAGALAQPAGLAPAAGTATPTTGAAEAVTAARAVGVTGTVFITRADGRRSTLAQGTALQAGDTLSTTRNSTARVRFTDGGETVLRPESVLQIQAYRFSTEQPQDDNLVLRLWRGGLRAITGQISKRGQANAYQLNINTATVGIRGTDYSARLCEVGTADCSPAPSAAPTRTQGNAPPPVVARIVGLQGEVRVQRGSTPDVAASTDTPLYVGDRVTSGDNAHAVVVFRDNTRVVVNPASAVLIEQFRYVATDSGAGSFLLQLVRGGLRAATGFIGRQNPGQFKVQTRTSTVGIRGTVFDLVCGDSHATGSAPPPAVAAAECDRSLYAATRSGEISLGVTGGPEVAVPAGRAGVSADVGNAALLLDAVPDYFSRQTSPAPESVNVDLDTLFGAAAPPPPENGGIFVLVHDGRITLAQSGIDVSLDAGESAYAGVGSVPQRLSVAPAVLDRDPFLSDRMFNSAMCRR